MTIPETGSTASVQDGAGLEVRTRDLMLRYGRRPALDGVTCTVRPGSVTGLLGPNGSGKSTLAQVLAGRRPAHGGSVLVGGADPFENTAAMAATCLVSEAGEVLAGERIAKTLALHAALRPTWDGELCARLLDRFEVSVRTEPDKLSRGKRSVLAMSIGLASRAPLTILDEVQLGMDAATRQAFTRELLADYAGHPRTVVISSHLIVELEGVVEDVVVLDRGKAVFCGEADSLRSRLVSLIGRQDVLDPLIGDRKVLSGSALGPTRQVTLATADGDDRAALLKRAQAQGIQAAAVPLQDAVIALTGRPGPSPTATSIPER